MYQDMKIIDFIEEVDSPSPAPGGGSVAGLCGALGVALSRMYAHLSISKKRFKELDEATQLRFIKAFQDMEETRTALLYAIDKDSAAYTMVMDAYHLPKETTADQAIRTKAIQEATITAIDSPYQIMESCIKVMKTFMDIIPYGNKNAVSDIAVGVLLLDTAVKSAGYNVRINLSAISDKTIYETWLHKMNEQLALSESLKDLLIAEAEKYL